MNMNKLMQHFPTKKKSQLCIIIFYYYNYTPEKIEIFILKKIRFRFFKDLEAKQLQHYIINRGPVLGHKNTLGKDRCFLLFFLMRIKKKRKEIAVKNDYSLKRIKTRSSNSSSFVFATRPFRYLCIISFKINTINP